MKPQQLTNLNIQQQLSFPTHPSTAYDFHLAVPITDYVQSYHSAPWIHFQDNIQYEDPKQYLKRYYRFGEFSNKIKLLSDYYRYHFQVPRLFIDGIARILQDNIDDRRELQYALVTKQMNKQQVDNFASVNTNRGIQKHQKLIKDIELSYEDFQQKPTKKQKQVNKKVEEEIKKSLSNASLQRMMTRVDSIKFKGSFLVFKPREPIVKEKHEERNKMLQPKYKKPKQTKPKQKERQKKSKRIIDMHQKVGKKQMPDKEKQKSKYNSKMTSANNSVASQKGLSRSKSRTHLNVGGLCKNTQNESNVENKSQKGKQKLSYGSLQNSLAKSCSKNQILVQRKGITNAMSRKGSKIDLKMQDQSGKHKKKENESGTWKIGNGKQRVEVESRKMFSRALEIKQRKQ